MIDWVHFTPISAIAGGVMIGLSANILWLGMGRIAGISGIVGGVFETTSSDLGWRIAFAFGLMSAPVIYTAMVAAPTFDMQSATFARLIPAGLLVGFGTRLGSGCTSGHGVCGIARLSPRSLAATAAFMASGILTTYVIRHVAGV
jgi:uncharacterized membrane protein YedE/YeeE